MSHARQICRRLHEEHLGTLDLWGKIEQACGARTRPESELVALLRRGAAEAALELERHFAFEEAELFPRLAEAGEADIASLLEEEHGTIRDAARGFIELARGIGEGEAPPPPLRRLALELAERLFAHVQKEEMALLPLLDDLLDEATDESLVMIYSGN
ncbi:MAG: hemerythrin domain-containing protein [Betaproteobacteria bacterium]|nr:hemerythrin domain-containing protein [Betaproteobacteria bacterium]